MTVPYIKTALCKYVTCCTVLDQLNATESWEEIDLRKAASISKLLLCMMNFMRTFLSFNTLV